MRALGCHVFAGGFTQGVRKIFDVEAQMEIHDLGRDTVESMGIEFFRTERWEDWMERTELIDVDFLFGNPRCTGFSCVSAGCGEDAHGAWSKPTKDAHEFCQFGVRAGIPIICWESVQQAITVGKELLDYFRDEVFLPNGYRVAHVLCNAGSFGNAQHRKRYFFVAYREDLKFNVTAPALPERHTTINDVIMNDEMLGADTYPTKFRRDTEYTEHAWWKPTDAELALIPHLPEGWCFNTLARRREEVLEEHSPLHHEKWRFRTSDMPFSMHCVSRLNKQGYCPVLAGSCFRYAHPVLHRLCTVGELSALMGWEFIPKGHSPFAQLGKGIVPSVGTWIAEMVQKSLLGEWNGEDWDCAYDDVNGVWVGQNHAVTPPEKTFNLTRYCPEKPRNK